MTRLVLAVAALGVAVALLHGACARGDRDAGSWGTELVAAMR
jgi:hypothetical protein